MGFSRPASGPRWTLTSKSVLIAFMIGMLFWLNRLDNLADRVWSDLLTVSQKLPTSGQFIAVNLMERDLSESASPSAFRQVLAQRIAALRHAGVKRILLDVFLPAGERTTSGDIQLAKAFSDFGRDKIAFGKAIDHAFVAPQQLRNAAVTLDLGLLGDTDGYFRSVRLQSSSALGNPAVWLATGKLDNGSTALDLRLDPGSIPTYTLSDIVRPEVLKQLKGKTIILGIERSAARSRASLPVYGAVDRSRFLALSAESSAQGSTERFTLGTIVSAMLAIGSLCSGLILGARIQSIRSGLAVLPVLYLAVIASCLLVNFQLGAPAYPSTLMAIGTMGMMVALAYRLRLPELLAGLFAGDLSPEEAWLWRSQADQARPVLIFGADGSLRRSNPAAMAAFELDAQKQSERALQLARQCMPEIGSRAEVLTSGDPVPTKWRLEWPHKSIPLAVFFDVTDQAVKEETLHRKLMTDPLTGLNNRLGFDTALRAIDLDGGAAFAIFYLDMNGFKQVNDTLGHDAGDELLRVVARRFQSAVRDGDVLARLGGDEFGLCVIGSMTDAQAQALVDKLQSCLASPIRLEQGEVKVGVAIGFGIRTAMDTTTDEIIRRADAAMYQNKRARRETDPSRQPEQISA